MQIFFIDNDPVQAAQDLQDVHVRKQVLETTQILSMNIRFLIGEVRSSNLYKDFNINHPVVKWARINWYNFQWTLRHLEALQKEYSYRTEKLHKSYVVYMQIKKICDDQIFSSLFGETSYNRITPLLEVKDKTCIVGNDAITTYRKDYIKNKLEFKRFGPASWTKRSIPDWIFDSKYM